MAQHFNQDPFRVGSAASLAFLCVVHVHAYKLEEVPLHMYLFSQHVIVHYGWHFHRQLYKQLSLCQTQFMGK